MCAAAPDDFRHTRVFVQGIPEGVTWEELKRHFGVAGPVAWCSLSVDEQGRPKGVGIVQYETPEAARRAITVMKQHPLRGQVLNVREDRQERARRQVRPGREWAPRPRTPPPAAPPALADVNRAPGEVPWREEGPPAPAERAARVLAALKEWEALREQGRLEAADEVLARLRRGGVRLNVNRRSWRLPPAPVALHATTGARDSPPLSPLGPEGLRKLLETAAASMGPCRFIVANAASGGILEAVQDFGAVPLRYSTPRPTGTFCTLGTNLFECHLNLDKVHTVVFARPQRPRPTGDGEYSMYVMRFLDAEGKVALSVLLHSDDFPNEVYDTPTSGHPAAWHALVATYGEQVVVQAA